METIRWLRSVIQPGTTAIDVGANVGQMTLEMAQLTGPRGRIIAIEPGPGNLAVLRKHIEANGFSDRVTVVDAACCAAHGEEMDLEIPAANVDEVGSGFQLAGIGTVPNPMDRGSPRVRLKVATVTLDQLMADLKVQPAVLKIDVEGAELEVLRGARGLLHTCRPEVSVGFHPFAFDLPAAAQSTIISLLGDAGLTFGKSEAAAWTLGEYFASRVDAEKRR
jgi:FkbM family methyltransferase